MWTENRDISESDDVAKSRPVSYRTINQYGGKLVSSFPEQRLVIEPKEYVHCGNLVNMPPELSRFKNVDITSDNRGLTHMTTTTTTTTITRTSL